MPLTQHIFELDLDTEGFTPTERQRDEIRGRCDRIPPLVEEFPTQTLHVNLHFNENSKEYEVKLCLILPGQTFATGNVSQSWQSSLDQCVQKMIRRIEHYKTDLERHPEHAHSVAGTTTPVAPNRQIDGHRVSSAIDRGDYVEFRKAMFPLEESLRQRIGRWVQRYPKVQAMVGERITINDLVEETFIMAFDEYHSWQPEMFFGQWIETLIDPTIRAIARDPDGLLEQISFQRSWDETR